MERNRCRWADPSSELYIAYHDQEWGRPEHDDQKLFEMLFLEVFGRHFAEHLTALILPSSLGTAPRSWRR